MKNNAKSGHDKKWIQLCVGGTNFTTTGSTLIKGSPPNSPLYRISTNSTNVEWDRDDRGAYMIDRDPNYFQIILNYLRHGRLVLHKNVPEEAILIEAEYYHLPELIKLINNRLILTQQQLQQTQQYQQRLQQQFMLKSSQQPVPLLDLNYPQPDSIRNYVNYILDTQV